jgi:hypothetical protein
MGINNMRASQARLSANNFADDAEKYFEQDYDIEVQYHSLLNGIYSFFHCTTWNLMLQIGLTGKWDQ